MKQVKKGEKYGRLTAIRKTDDYITHRGNHYERWLFKCECGGFIKVIKYSVLSGNTQSCGCKNKDRLKTKIAVTHGLSRCPTWNSWQSMKCRCLNKNNNRYKYYGGKGIMVCKRWMKFQNFLSDMGERPVGMTIDRIDSNGNYEPKNCRWATPKEQARDVEKRAKKYLFRGKMLTLNEISKKLAISRATLYTRLITLKMDEERAFSGVNYRRKALNSL